MKKFKVVLLSFLSLILFSCSDSGNGKNSNNSNQVPTSLRSSSGGATEVPDIPTGLGRLPNGSQIIIAQPAFEEQPTASLSTYIYLTSADSESTAYRLSFTALPAMAQESTTFKNRSLPSIVAADNCTLAGNQNCRIVVNSNNAPLGTYYMTPIFTDLTTGAVSYANPVSYTVTNNPVGHHEDGKLIIMLSSTSIAQIGDSISGFVGLSTNQTVESLTVEIYPTKVKDGHIASVTPQTCVVSSTTGCPISITGLESGTTSFTVRSVQSPKYKAATSPEITVHAPIVLGYLTLQITPNSLNYGGVAAVKVSLENSLNVSDLVVNFASESSLIATTSPQECVILSSKAPNNVCDVMLSAGSITGYNNIIAYVNNNTYVPVVKTVYVHPVGTYGDLQVRMEDSSIAYGETTNAIVSLVNSSYVDNVVVSAQSSNSAVASVNSPSGCTLSSHQSSCKIPVTGGRESGVVNIIASAAEYLPAQASLNVHPTPIPGALSVTLSPNTIATQAVTVANITLENSLYVDNAIVTVASTVPGIATTVGNNICHLSSTRTSCQVQVKGLATGSAGITATATGYTTPPATLDVITPGTVSITPSKANIVYDQTTPITVTLNGSVGVNNAIVKLSTSDASIATVANCAPATLSSSNTTCTAIVTGEQLSGAATISASVSVGDYTYPTVKNTVNVTPSVLPGTLAITPAAVSVPKGSTTTLTVSLNNSRLITTPITVTVTLQDLRYIQATTQKCQLSTDKPTCSVVVYGVELGASYVYANSPGYATASSHVTVTTPLPIPQQCSNAANATFNTATRFDSVSITSYFSPVSFNKAPNMSFYSGGVLNVADGSNIASGGKVLTDASSTNPVTVGAANRVVNSSAYASGSTTTNACGGAWASSSAQITSSVDLTQRGLVHLHMNNNSSGHCGSQAPAVFDADISVNGYSATVYNAHDSGCGGGNWDIGGIVSVNGNGCSGGSSCLYTVSVTASHGGVGGQCKDTQTRTFALSFARPQIYLQLSGLANFNLQNPNPYFVAKGGQTQSATIGGQAVATSPIVICSSGGCRLTNPDGVWYGNGLISTTMTYAVGLLSGDSLGQTCVNFRLN